MDKPASGAASGPGNERVAGRPQNGHARHRTSQRPAKPQIRPLAYLRVPGRPASQAANRTSDHSDATVHWPTRLLPSDVLRIPRPAQPAYRGARGVMLAPVTVQKRDLRALAAIVSEDRPDLPDGEGLPPSLLADLMGQIRCDVVAFAGFDSGRQQMWTAQL